MPPVTLTLRRRPSGVSATIGSLEIMGRPFCDTLEDVVREVAGLPVSQWKVAGETAIPAGTYRVEITYSQRFRCDLPLLMDVPGFTGIRIHAGNTDADTEGCILVGTWREGEQIINSRAALARLMGALDSYPNRDILMEIINP